MSNLGCISKQLNRKQQVSEAALWFTRVEFAALFFALRGFVRDGWLDAATTLSWQGWAQRKLPNQGTMMRGIIPLVQVTWKATMLIDL